MAARQPRKRDPEARRGLILDAAREVIAEVGTERATHRAIAKRAGVPLGSTTQYFPTRADLVAAALARTTDDWRHELANWQAALEESEAIPATLAALLREYLANGDLSRIETELYLAASRDPALLPLARQWLDGLAAVLAPWADPESAAAVAAFIDGATLQAVVTGTRPSAEFLEQAIARLLP